MINDLSLAILTDPDWNIIMKTKGTSTQVRESSCGILERIHIIKVLNFLKLREILTKNIQERPL